MSDYLKAIRLPLLSCLAMAAIVAGIKIIMGTHVSKTDLLAVECVTGAATYIIIVYFGNRWLRDQFKKVPQILQNYFTYLTIPKEKCDNNPPGMI